MIEKKLILCSILAITIGIATIMPLGYVMSLEVVQATSDKPWFNINVPYVYCNPYKNGDNAIIQGLANFTFTPDALALKDAEAKIEYYQFHVYSEQGSIVNISYSIALSKEELNVTGIPNGVYTAITGSGGNTFSFANGLTYNGIKDYSGDSGGGSVWYMYNEPELTNQTIATAGFSDYISSTKTQATLPFPNATVVTNDYSTKGNNTAQIITQLRSAQELYIDVSRICTVIYNGNITINTPSDPNILQHLVLTKTPTNSFVYGNYVQSTAPFLTETP